MPEILEGGEIYLKNSVHYFHSGKSILLRKICFVVYMDSFSTFSLLKHTSNAKV
jgi:hypothetical protein